MTEELQQLIDTAIHNRCETQTLEIKSAKDGAPRVYDSLSSFSNQNEGGIILFGIDEQAGFSICGVYDAQDLQKKIHGQCESMTPEVRPTFETVTINNKTVVAVYINGRPMSERPVYRTIKGISEGTYTRIGDADVRMTATELYEIESFKEGRRDDITTNPEASITMLDKNKVSQFVIDAAKERPLLSRRSTNEILSLSGVIRNEIPTLAGMLTLGDYPQQLYPNLCITAIAVSGTTLQPEEDGTRFLDNKRYEGSISDMLDGAMNFVARNAKTKVIIRDGERVDIPQYPETAIREIILNALMHRDYGPYCNGTPIRLVMYADRLECWNPGGIYGGQSINDLGYANLPTRNPTLVSLLEIQHVAENRHSGIPVIREEAQSNGMRSPEFVVRNGSFLVRFFNTPQPENTAASLATSPHHDYKESNHTRKVRENITKFCESPRTAQEIADHFKYNLRYLKRNHLQPMVESGQLILSMPDKPQSRHQTYQALQ